MKGFTSILAWKKEEVLTGKSALTRKKVRNATLKKLYERKLASLANRDLPPHLLRTMCQDAPVAKDDLVSPQGRHSFVKKCVRYYRGAIREIERSEKKGLLGFFSGVTNLFA